jgi:hypothetical protein
MNTPINDDAGQNDEQDDQDGCHDVHVNTMTPASPAVQSD